LSKRPDKVIFGLSAFHRLDHKGILQLLVLQLRRNEGSLNLLKMVLDQGVPDGPCGIL